MGAHKVTAGYVTVETKVGESRAHIDIAGGEFLPADVPAEQIETLLARGHIVPVDDDPEGSGVDENGDGVPEGSTAQVLAWVAGDTVKARAALEAETAKPEARKGLVAELSKLVPAE